MRNFASLSQTLMLIPLLSRVRLQRSLPRFLRCFKHSDEICNIKQHYEGEMSSMKERVEAYESFTKKRMEA
ncbi:hypothetical protein QL285_054053 [Trifolium repens]|nr:hypothetical protein QL285_054053 [Trifolium repens]